MTPGSRGPAILRWFSDCKVVHPQNQAQKKVHPTDDTCSSLKYNPTINPAFEATQVPPSPPRNPHPLPRLEAFFCSKSRKAWMLSLPEPSTSASWEKRQVKQLRKSQGYLHIAQAMLERFPRNTRYLILVEALGQANLKGPLGKPPSC